MSEDKKPNPIPDPKKDAGKIFLEELTAGPPSHLPWWRRVLRTLTIPVLAIITGLIVGGIIIVLTTEGFWAQLSESPLLAIQTGLRSVSSAYSALFTGAIGG